MAAPLLEAERLSKRFGGFLALDEIDLSVTAGERVGLIGPNGSGKSTLVNCLCGALVNEAGTVRFEGRDLTGLAAHQRTRLGMARSFQLPRPFTSMTIADNLKVPLLYTIDGRRKPPTESEIGTRCEELLTLVGLADRAWQLPRDLTQVDMRKLELARAMATQPKLLIADEAMAGLSNSEVNDIVALHHSDPDRTYHACGDELLPPSGGAGLRQKNCRRPPRRRDARCGGREGVSWSIA